MKFIEQFKIKQNPLWENYYFNYEKINKLFQQFMKEEKKQENYYFLKFKEISFQEIEKINSFYKIKEKEIILEIKNFLKANLVENLLHSNDQISAPSSPISIDKNLNEKTQLQQQPQFINKTKKNECKHDYKTEEKEKVKKINKIMDLSLKINQKQKKREKRMKKKRERKKLLSKIHQISLNLFLLKEFSCLNLHAFKSLSKKFDKLKLTNKKAKTILLPQIYQMYFVKSEKLEKFELKIEQKILDLNIEDDNNDDDEEESEDKEGGEKDHDDDEGEEEKEELKKFNYDEFNFERFKKGKITKCWITIMNDALHRPIKIPTIIAVGKIHGPKVLITSTIHGNEVNGIPLIQKLFQEINIDELSGILCAIPVYNTPGFLIGQRYFSDGSDLNRSFLEESFDLNNKDTNNSTPTKKIKSSNIYNQRIFENIVSKFEYLMDLHTAGFGRINSLYCRADLSDDFTKRMALITKPQIVVNNQGIDGSLRGSAQSIGIKAVTIEIGNPLVFQKRFIKNALLGVSEFIKFLNMIPSYVLEPSDIKTTVCTSSYWIYCDCGGILTVFPTVNTWVKKNQKIAKLCDIFGKVIKYYYSKDDGIVIGRNHNPLVVVGDTIIHLGICGGDLITSKNQNMF